MKNNNRNNIFFINNKLEKYTKNLEKEAYGFNFISVSIDTLEDEVNKIDVYTSKERNLIIMCKQVCNDLIQEKIKSVFHSKLLIDYPHFLFISLDPDDITDDTDVISFEDDFFYSLSEDELQSDILEINHFSLKLIFQRLNDLKILQHYIIDSFKTIVDAKIVDKEKDKIEKLYENLKISSRIDPLTNVLNRHALFEAIESERKRAKRNYWKLKQLYNKAENEKSINQISNFYAKFACLMIDIDNFKPINDVYGHIVGDQVLRKLGELLNTKSLFRDTDVIGRYGGEEFIVLLTDTNAKQAYIPAERLRNNVKAIKFCTDKGVFTISVSIGIAEYDIADSSNEQLIDRADKALYAAKKNGKDKTVIYKELTESEL